MGRKHHSKEHREKIAASVRRHVRTEEHRNAIGAKQRASYDKMPIGELLAKGRNGTFIRKVLVRRGIWKDRCRKCGVGPEWQEEPLTLEVHHKDGVRGNNRLENLELLCPNCHSQTRTFRSKRR